MTPKTDKEIALLNKELSEITERGSEAQCLAVLDKGANGHGLREDGASFLHFAASRGYSNLAMALIEKGVDINGVTETCFKETALHAAAKKGDAQMCDALIAKGLHTDAVDAGGETALHWAAVAGLLEVCQVLIKWGALVNLKNSDGIAPLHQAAVMGQADVCALLITSGADARVLTGFGMSALDLAVKKEHSECIHILRACNAAKTARQALQDMSKKANTPTL